MKLSILRCLSESKSNYRGRPLGLQSSAAAAAPESNFWNFKKSSKNLLWCSCRTWRFLAVTVVNTHCHYPRADGQAELAWVDVYIMREKADDSDINKMCSETANSAKALQCRRLVSEHISYKCLSLNAKESDKMMLDLYPDPDKHRNLTASTGSTLARACHAWSTSVNAFVSYRAHRTTNERPNDR